MPSLRTRIAVLAGAAFLVSCATPATGPAPVDAQWIEQVGADHNHEVLKCYEASLKLNPKLAGDFMLELDADHAGAVTDVRVKKSLDHDFDACVVAQARSWNFPWIKKQTFSIQDPYHLSLKDGQPFAEFGGPGMDHEVVRVIVREHIDEVRSCYETRLRTQPDLAGKLILQWDINQAGQVANARAKEPFDKVVDACVIARVSKWKFPEPPNNRVAQVSYPFEFSPHVEDQK